METSSHAEWRRPFETHERNHLRFHAAFFALQIDESMLRRVIFRAAFFIVGIAAATVVLFDHRHLFRALGLSKAECSRSFRSLLGDVFLERVKRAPHAQEEELVELVLERREISRCADTVLEHLTPEEKATAHETNLFRSIVL